MIEHIPLLRTQRELFELPRGMERFKTYLDTLTDDAGDMALPLAGMNPMGHAHNVELLDDLLAMDAEGVAAMAVQEANRRLTALDLDLRVALVVVDDVRGQWTNRYFTEASHRFENRGEIRRGWTSVPCWTSETWSNELIGQETLAAIYRVAHTLEMGPARSLEEMMTQEGLALSFAHAGAPTLKADDLDYSRTIIEPLLQTTDFPTIFAVLYGDEAASSAGYTPLGLSERAGYAVALAQAKVSNVSPEEELLRNRKAAHKP